MGGLRERLVASELRDDPYPLFKQLRADAPVWQLPGERAYMVSRWDLVAEATGRVADFSNHFRHTLFSHEDGTLGVLETGATGPDVFAGADAPAHTAHRRIFFSELTQSRMAALESYVEDLTVESLAVLFDRDGVDAAVGLAQLIPIQVVANRVIGFREPDLERLREWVFAGSRLMGGLVTLDEMASLADEASELATWTMSQLRGAAIASTEENVLGSAALAVREGMLTLEEAAFAVMVLVGAGAETTTSLIGNAIGVLATLPELQDELRADPRKIPAFLEEVLRLESPFRHHPRTATHPVEMGGVEIPEGALVMLSWSAANRDESMFAHPDEIDLDRDNVHAHLGFGRGIHHCVGAPLARLEARVVLTELIERTTSFTLDAGRPQRWADSVWVHRHESLPLLLEPR